MKKEQTEREKRNKEYNEYVKQVTPTHSLVGNCIKAFVTGGIICVVGQFVMNTLMGYGMDKELAGLWNTVILILLSVILTSLNIYPSIAKWGGAGALVPITGFANGVASSAMEFKKEGWVFGVGARIFQIAGPVILYGIVISWLLGLLYWLWGIIV